MEAATEREHVADRREYGADIREEIVHSREGTASSREQKIGTDATRLAAEHMKVLQQANERLVIAALEARELMVQVEKAKVQLSHLAHHDPLTGLPNRMLLHDRISQAIELASRQGTQLAVLFLDLDQFKHINDSLGHATGDRLLRSVAQCLLGCVRNSDTVSRQGGGEFVILLSNIKQAQDAEHCTKKILKAMATPHRIDKHEFHVSASIGIATYPGQGSDAGSLLQGADTAMHRAKVSGRNQYKCFVQEMNVKTVERQSIESSLHTALERRELFLHYQPKINLQTGSITGAEALVRWQHPELGLVPPSRFVPIAEDCGLIVPIGRWVMREACLQACAWRDGGLTLIPIAVNTSAVEFAEHDFLDHVRATLQDTYLEPRHLEIELTESTLMQDAGRGSPVLYGLADMGVRLAIDDFGTGYSSLGYLRHFPVHTLKIDQSFIGGMSSNADDAIIVSAVISMGKSLKLRVIGEGVETREQCAFLRAQHCDEGQGYYFSRPVTPAAFATLLQTGVLPTCAVRH